MTEATTLAGKCFDDLHKKAKAAKNGLRKKPLRKRRPFSCHETPKENAKRLSLWQKAEKSYDSALDQYSLLRSFDGEFVRKALGASRADSETADLRAEQAECYYNYAEKSFSIVSNNEKALDNARKAVSLDPTDAKGYLLQAHIQTRLATREAEDAARDLKEAAMRRQQGLADADKIEKRGRGSPGADGQGNGGGGNEPDGSERENARGADA